MVNHGEVSKLSVLPPSSVARHHPHSKDSDVLLCVLCIAKKALFLIET